MVGRWERRNNSPPPTSSSALNLPAFTLDWDLSVCVGQAAFGGSGTQSNGLIWRFVFPPSGIWCQFSESFGPNCGWNVDHHSLHLSGQPCPTKTTRHCYHGLLQDTAAGFCLRLTVSIFFNNFVLFSYLVCLLVLLHYFCWLSTQMLLKV